MNYNAVSVLTQICQVTSFFANSPTRLFIFNLVRLALSLTHSLTHSSFSISPHLIAERTQRHSGVDKSASASATMSAHYAVFLLLLSPLLTHCATHSPPSTATATSTTTTTHSFSDKAFQCLHSDNRAANEDTLHSLLSDNCMRAGRYATAKNSYPLEQTFSPQELQCLSRIRPLAACSHCYLCFFYLQHNHSLAAFNSAVQSLEFFPHSAAPPFHCLAKIYYSRGNILRSAFYASGMTLN